MKTKEELNALKNEVEAMSKKLAELSKEELESVTGGEDGNGFNWPIVDVGDRLFDCYGREHMCILHYTVEDRFGHYWTHITGVCSKCGAYNDYYIT